MAPLVKVKRVGQVQVPLPRYETAGSAGMDLCAALAGKIHLAPGERQLIPTGLAVALPPGFEAQVRPRSGLALKGGLTVINSPGTIDQDYRGEIGIVLINHGSEDYVIEPLSRIAQLVIAPVVQARLEEVTELDATERGAGGYGSTGI